MKSKDVVIPKNIEDICDTRRDVVDKIKTCYRLFGECASELNRLGNHVFPYDAHPRKDLESTIKEIDARLWRHAFDKTGLFQYMDRIAKDEFDKGLEKEPPEFNLQNVRSTLMDTAAQARGMFIRGLVEFFLSLSKNYATNTKEPFKVSERAVVRWAVTNWFGEITVNNGTYSRGASTFNDLDRVMKTLDEKQHHPRELENKLNEAWKVSNIYEDQYYQIKGFKNGNAHILFKRSDLLEKANKLISEYYNGSALAGRTQYE
jgi:hypothetical protein